MFCAGHNTGCVSQEATLPSEWCFLGYCFSQHVIWCHLLAVDSRCCELYCVIRVLPTSGCKIFNHVTHSESVILQFDYLAGSGSRMQGMEEVRRVVINP